MEMIEMQTNDKLTAAARRGAQGHTAAGIGVFSTLSADKQQALIASVLSDKALTEEVVRTSLNAMPAAEIEDMLNAMGETRGDKSFHTGSTSAKDGELDDLMRAEHDANFNLGDVTGDGD